MEQACPTFGNHGGVKRVPCEAELGCLAGQQHSALRSRELMER